MMKSRLSGDYVCHDKIDNFSRIDLESQLINTKPLTKNKLRSLLGELKKFKVHTVLVSEY